MLRDRSGVSAIEFAVLAPIVLVIVTAAFEGFALHGAALALETGAAAAARLGSLTAPGAVDRNAALRAEIMAHLCPPGGARCPLSDSPLPPGDDGLSSPLQIRFHAYADPRNIGQPEPFADLEPLNGTWDPGETFSDLNGDGRWNADMGAPDLGGSGDFVVYEVAMAEDVRHPLLRAALGSPLVRTATFVVRNEPY
jgi:Flp pilus assembly pilin Flp